MMDSIEKERNKTMGMVTAAPGDDRAAIVEAARAIGLIALRAVEDGVDGLMDVATHVVDATLTDRRVLVFGAGHATMFGMELYSRAGGLRCYELMNLGDLEDGKRPFGVQLSDSGPERDTRNGARLIDHYGIAAGDIVLIASNSGRNGAAVELALRCKDLGVYTAAFTSVAHSEVVESRHASGLRLFEVSDVVVDNGGPVGDALLSDARVGKRYVATSSVSFCMLAQALNVAVVRVLLSRGMPVDVLVSANI